MGNIRTAVILAAGLGSRIQSYSKDFPKGFIPVDNVPIIKQSITKLLESGITGIIIGTGHKSEFYESLISDFPQIRCVKNPHFASTGSMFTLNRLKGEINDDFLLLESDLLYDKAGLGKIIHDPHDSIILASGFTQSGDEVFIETDAENNLVNVSKKRNELNSIYGELTGISKISLSLFHHMNDYAEDIFNTNPMLDYEYTMVGVRKMSGIHVLKIEDYAWCEIDDEDHLARAVNSIYPSIVKSESGS